MAALQVRRPAVDGCAALVSRENPGSDAMNYRPPIHHFCEAIDRRKDGVDLIYVEINDRCAEIIILSFRPPSDILDGFVFVYMKVAPR
ncbi:MULTISPECIES: hypothetical protein [Bordetella]|uniref:hypothetical protein n=1 Tax=Bordetella TaxID=517 RepID=UPI000FD90695|nr:MULTISPECIES: hypothetical protein [Bordetella]